MKVSLNKSRDYLKQYHTTRLSVIPIGQAAHVKAPVSVNGLNRYLFGTKQGTLRFILLGLKDISKFRNTVFNIFEPG